MTIETKSVIRCAIYTRKSSEEGLEMSFNSLDAQREACHAFIISQRHEGWRVLPALYDDGGYSGGTLERPALKRLLGDIGAGKVDTIVVYKIDRLTRSLLDFAKIVEALDACGVSFVSVTQQFNTTTSMGRLTLNVLLSFAQFEREVTGERIRDKIAASKRKGMWMGGTIPLGYDLKERKLIANPKEAELVCDLYRLYLKLGCVSKLKIHLDQQGIKSKIRLSVAGKRSGGTSYSRGALYDILQNRTYLGQIHHRGQNYPGEHRAIIPEELWEQVQAKFKSDNQGRRHGLKANSPSMLAGLLQDATGNRFTPSHTSKNGKRYRYYVCNPNNKDDGESRKAARLPAHDVERQVVLRLRSFLQSSKEVMDDLALPGDSPDHTRRLMAAASERFQEWTSISPTAQHEFVRTVVRRVVVHPDRIEIEASKTELRTVLTGDHPASTRRSEPGHQRRHPDDVIRLAVDARIKRCGIEIRLVVPPGSTGETPAHLVPSLLKAVARGHDWYQRIVGSTAGGRRSLSRQTGLDDRYVSRILKCGFLAPDIVEAILDGQQPADFSLERLRNQLPLSWIEQRKQLGFPARP
jgi:site-specific DNA recombinase